MSNDLEQTNVIVFVFAMRDCSACHEYLPALQKQVALFQEYGFPFVLYEKGHTLSPGEIPVMIFDSASDDPNLQALADQYAVEALPTTVVVSRTRGPLARVVGIQEELAIYKILQLSAEANA